LKVKRENNNIIFILNGDIILQNEEKIKKDIIDTLQKSTDYQNVFINMENVTFLDSSGIGMLVYINGFLRSSGKVLNLLSPSPEIFKILRLGTFDKLFKIEKQ
jgi:anti-anti-sigma factor